MTSEICFKCMIITIMIIIVVFVDISGTQISNWQWWHVWFIFPIAYYTLDLNTSTRCIHLNQTSVLTSKWLAHIQLKTESCIFHLQINYRVSRLTDQCHYFLKCEWFFNYISNLYYCYETPCIQNIGRVGVVKSLTSNKHNISIYNSE